MSGLTGATTSTPEFVFASSAAYGSTGVGPNESGWNVTNVSGNQWIGYQIATVPGKTYSWTQPSSYGWAVSVVTIAATTESRLLMASFP